MPRDRRPARLLMMAAPAVLAFAPAASAGHGPAPRPAAPRPPAAGAVSRPAPAAPRPIPPPAPRPVSTPAPRPAAPTPALFKHPDDRCPKGLHEVTHTTEKTVSGGLKTPFVDGGLGAKEGQSSKFCAPNPPSGVQELPAAPRRGR